MKTNYIPLLLMVAVTICFGQSQSDRDILIGRLSGPSPGQYPVSETLFRWIDEIVSGECGLTAQLFDSVVTEEEFVSFNELAIESGVSAFMIGSYDIRDGAVLVFLDPMQVYANPSNFIDREHISRPEEMFEFDLDLLDDPSSPPDFIGYFSYMLASLAHYNMMEHETALTEVESAIALSSDLPPELLAATYLLSSQIRMAANGMNSSALADLDMALEVDPGCLRARLSRGYCYELAGDYDSALEQYDLAIELDPTLYKSYRLRANLYSNCGYHEESISDYSTAVMLNPGDHESWYYGALAYLAVEDYPSSIEWFSRTIDLEPESAMLFTHRAIACASIYEMDQALEDITRAIELDPENSSQFETAAQIRVARNEPSECIETVNRGLEIDPASVQLLMSRTKAYLLLEDIDAALGDITLAREIIENSSEYSTSESLNDMFTILSTLSGMEPGSPMYHRWYGSAFSRGGLHEETIEQFTLCLELDAGIVEAYYLRGLSYLEVGDTNHALTDMYRTRALLLEPSDKEALQEIINEIIQLQLNP